MTRVEILNEFSKVSQNPYQWTKRYVKSSGQKTVGYFCSYVPEELLHAAGFLPVRILGNQQFSPQINSHLQSYCCFNIKGSLGLLLDDRLDFLHSILFSHTCDSMQCLSDIWEINSKIAFFETFNMPTKLDIPSSLDYLVDEMYQLKSKLESFNQQLIAIEKIIASIRLYNEFRHLMRKLNQLRIDFPQILTVGEMNNIVTASLVMPKEYCIDLLEILLNLLQQQHHEKTSVIKLFIEGSICNDPQILNMIEELNGTVVDDNLCVGSRYFERDVTYVEDPIKGITESLINRIYCPCKHSTNIDRVAVLVKRIIDSGADGVIFYLLKYCEPYFFDYPYLKDKLSAMNIPSLLIEAEKPGHNLEQIKNKLQAFLEKLMDE